jgi:hypothetical protein
MGTNILKIWIENYVRGKRDPPMIWVRLLKKRRKEVKVDSKLGGQWKVKDKHLFTSSHFPPNKFYLNLQFFPLILRFYFTMVFGRYSRISFFFFDL